MMCGKLDKELDHDIAYRIGRATAQSLGAKTLALGFDARETSPSLAKAVATGVVTLAPIFWSLAVLGPRKFILPYQIKCWSRHRGYSFTIQSNIMARNLLRKVRSHSRKMNLFKLKIWLKRVIFKPLVKGSLIDLKQARDITYQK